MLFRSLLCSSAGPAVATGFWAPCFTVRRVLGLWWMLRPVSLMPWSLLPFCGHAFGLLRVAPYAVSHLSPIPSLLWEPAAPSSWKLLELQALACSGGVDSVHLDQCCCGAAWMKPTRFLAVGLPELAVLVSRLPGGGRCCPALGHSHVSLSGKDQEGRWRTAPAKTYNSDLCRLLAEAAFGAVGRLLHAHAGVAAADSELPEDLARFHVPLDHYDPES